MTEAINPINISNKGFAKNISPKIAAIPESPHDVVSFGNKNNTETTKEKQSFWEKFGVDIAAFSTGVIGLGASVKMGRINKKINQKAVSILESVGVKSSPVKSFFNRNIDNLEKLESVLIKDKLTGLFNRRYLDEYFKNAFNAAKKDGTDLHLFMFDIDKFKNVNTGLGHDGGDEVLKRTSTVISDLVEKFNSQGIKTMFARAGGEEFTLVVQGVPKEKALKIAQKMRSVVNQDEILKADAAKLQKFFEAAIKDLESRATTHLTEQEKHDLREFRIGYDLLTNNKGFTVSAGMCSLKDHNSIVDAPHEAIKFADIALQRTKDKGRNKLFEAGNDDLAKYAQEKLEAILEKIKMPEAERANLNNNISEKIEKLEHLKSYEEKTAKLKELLEMVSTYNKK